MSKREPRLLIEDLLEAANKIVAYTKGMDFDAFVHDEKTVDAVVRNFEIIGEAASRLPNEFKALHAQIAWKRIIGFRNRIVHEYFGIDHSIVWTIIQNNVPELVKEAQTLLEPNQ